jgi:hypothetical protein
MNILANGAVRAMPVTARTAELAFLIVFDMFVFLTLANGALTTGSGVASATFTHF